MATLNLKGVKPIKVQQLNSEDRNLIYERVTWKDNESPAIDAANLNKSEQMLYELCSGTIQYKSIDDNTSEASSDNLIQGFVKILNEEVAARTKDTSNLSGWSVENFKTLNQFIETENSTLNNKVDSNKASADSKFSDVDATLNNHSNTLSAHDTKIQTNTQGIQTNANNITSLVNKINSLDLAKVTFTNNSSKSTLELVKSIEEKDGQVSVSKEEFSLTETHIPNVSSNKIYFDNATGVTLTSKIKTIQSELQESIASVSTNQQQDATDINSLKNSVSTLSNKDTDLQNQITSVKSTADNAATNSDLQAAIKNLNDHITDAVIKNTAQDTSINSLSKSVSDISASLSSVNSNIKELQDTVDILEGSSDVSNLASRVESVEGDVQAVESSLSSLQSEVSSVKNTLDKTATKEELQSLSSNITTNYATKESLLTTTNIANTAASAATQANDKYDALKSSNLLYDFDEIIFTCGDAKTNLFE